MPAQSRVVDLILRWQDLREQSQTPTPEQICAETPELLDEFKRRIGDLESIDRRLDATPAAAASCSSPPTNYDPDLSFLRPCSHPSALGQLGPFRVLDKIGAGGMGWVLVAEDPVVQRRVALKVMKPGLADGDSQARARFLREAQTAAAFNHDHIIEVYQVGEDNGVAFIAMPLLKGRSLESRLRESAPVPRDLIMQVARETALGLAAAHQQGLLHRDIKPANLWLEERPPAAPGHPPTVRVKILDFGLARLQGDTRLTHAGAILGTPGYMSPEQINGQDVDGRSDLFSLGCVLYRMATGRPAFQRESLTATLRATAEEEPPDPAQFNPQLPPALSNLIWRLLSKKPDARPATAHELAAELTKLQMSPLSASAQPDAVACPPRRRWRLGRIAMSAAAAAVVLGAALGYWKWSSYQAGPSSPPAAAPLLAELDGYVWKKTDTSHKRSFADSGVLPLQEGDFVQIAGKSNRPAFFYLIQLESSGTAAPLYPWLKFEWDQRAAETPTDHFRWPDDPVKNAAPLSASPTGVEAFLLLVRDTPLSDQENARLPSLFAGFPAASKADLLRGAIWLSAHEAPKVNRDEDRGRLDVSQSKQLDDPVERVKTLLRVELPRVFADSRAVCYSFQGQ
jgi:serine/threonine protein kinase